MPQFFKYYLILGLFLFDLQLSIFFFLLCLDNISCHSYLGLSISSYRIPSVWSNLMCVHTHIHKGTHISDMSSLLVFQHSMYHKFLRLFFNCPSRQLLNQSSVRFELCLLCSSWNLQILVL